MPSQSIVVQQPAKASQLVLLSHGVGSVPQSLVGLAQWFAQRAPGAFVVSLASPEPSDISNGFQWFSVRGITEENRPARVAAAMPGFAASVQHWQQVAKVDAHKTLLAGFSQGAIMALESTKLDHPPAHRVVALAGRYAELPIHKPHATIHLLHGTADPVMPVAQAQSAFARLQHLQANATLDLVPGVGHEPHPAMLSYLAQRLEQNFNSAD
ncbi:esterase [Variovorax sp. HJSM1_2]|uniref:esterase n=1 Tax=Variovorax sp. HJSM1_2 TaxID=3366263 RepID=UPI003BC720C6